MNGLAISFFESVWFRSPSDCSQRCECRSTFGSPSADLSFSTASSSFLVASKRPCALPADGGLQVERLVLASYQEVGVVVSGCQLRLHVDFVSHSLEHRVHLEFEVGGVELVDVAVTKASSDVRLLGRRKLAVPMLDPIANRCDLRAAFAREELVNFLIPS